MEVSVIPGRSSSENMSWSRFNVQPVSRLRKRKLLASNRCCGCLHNSWLTIELDSVDDPATDPLYEI